MYSQNVYDAPFEDDETRKGADNKESQFHKSDNNDMLKELGLEPNDGVYESPVWSDSDVDSWGDDSKFQKDLEPSKRLSISKDISDNKPVQGTISELPLSIHSSHNFDSQEGNVDNKVLAKGLFLDWNIFDLFSGYRNIK